MSKKKRCENRKVASPWDEAWMCDVQSNTRCAKSEQNKKLKIDADDDNDDDVVS